ncbi:MAG: elongation factor P [Patescibacteria group bacterium]|nr:elongation factor P [Patescibacteria group bacterium]
MYSINDLKTGTTFEHGGNPFIVLDYQHSKMGRGGAVLRTKLKNLVTGAVVQQTFQSSDKFEEIRIERRKVQYLYNDSGRYYFMDQEDYTQFDMSKGDLDSANNFLKDGEIVQFQYYKGKPINIDLPVKMTFEVTEASEGLKGDTVSAATKQVKIETGLMVNVPLFVKQGDKIRVDTRTGAYVERA